jgi:signal transduction histidine kinase
MKGVSDSGTPLQWRDSVLDKVLTVAAIITPSLSALGLFLRPATTIGTADIAVIALAGLATPTLRLVPGLSVRNRVSALIAILIGTGFYLLARAGFAAGISVLIVSTCIIGVVYLGRVFGLGLIALSAIAHVVIGVLVTRGVLVLDPKEVDPLQMSTWIRMAGVTSLLATLLALVIDSVIRHVEANAVAVRRALAQLSVAYERLGQLHNRLEAAKEDERRFLAHELHDELGQTLTALKLRLQLGPRLAPASGVDIAAAIALVDDLIGRVRKMSIDLRPALLDEIGLVPALRAYLDNQSAASGVTMQLDADEAGVSTGAPTGVRLPPDLEIACFRVVQESVTNALRHGAASNMHVRFERSDGRVRMTIRDDGRGFDPITTLDEAAARGHLGVVGMRERVRARSGKFELNSEPGGGTTVAVELPIPN